MPSWRAKKRGFLSLGSKRGITLIETLVASAVLIFGVSVVLGVSNVVQKRERISRLSLTADRLAQDLLERVVVENCLWSPKQKVCQNLMERDKRSFSLWVKPNGEVKYTKEEAGEGAVEFEARFDVNTAEGCMSGNSHAHCTATVDGSSAWGVDRKLFEEEVGNLHNIRVTVSYLDPFNKEARFVSYQTRLAP